MKSQSTGKLINSNQGQALITMLVAIAVAMSILTATTIASVSQGKDIARSVLGRKVYYAAETGAEYALLKLMRNPSSCSGTDNISLGAASIEISFSVSGSDCVISSKAQEGTLIKTIQVEASYNTSQVFQYCCWIENP